MEAKWLTLFSSFCFCGNGLKQGEITSPLRFSLFINDLAADLIKNGKHGIQLLPDMIELFILLFADDIVLLSDTIVGLQNQLDVFLEMLWNLIAMSI